MGRILARHFWHLERAPPSPATLLGSHWLGRLCEGASDTVFRLSSFVRVLRQERAQCHHKR